MLWALLALTRASAWPAFGAVALAGAAIVAVGARPVSARVPRLLAAPPAWAFVGACAIAAAAISYAVARVSLHDTPLSIDAATYLMEARALAHGSLGAPIPTPAQAFGARFLFEGADGRMHGVFPPGWPLFVAPFVIARAPMLAGPFVAALLVVAQYALGRAVGARYDAAPDASSATASDSEIATRASLLLTLPSFARAIETADLLSHAFVAVLATTALACALFYAARPSRALGAAIGACIAWAFVSRLLDGVVLAIVVASVLALARPRVTLRPLAFAIVAAAPLLALLAIDQRAATGSALTPTQSEYFARADYPPTCHRLGFGADVGCNVEHPDAVLRDGPDGYGADDALGVVRERASVLGEDLFGFAPIALLAFVAPLRRRGVAPLAAFALALTLGYGLFYYGNAAAFGARHLFPAAPCFYLLVAHALVAAPHRARGWLDAPHARGAAIAAAVLATAIAQRPVWTLRLARVEAYHAARSDLRRTLARHGIARGVLRTRDETAYVAAFDPRLDDDRFVVEDDRSGLVELRRAHPGLPQFLALGHDEVGKIYDPPPPPPGLLVELERAWPSFQRPSGLGARPREIGGASGGAALDVAWSRDGATLTIPFDVVAAGRYELRVDGFAGPDHADWALSIDGAPLPAWRGYAASREVRRGESATLDLAAGRHALVARCTGRERESSGWRAEFDALVGEPAK